MQIQVLDLVKLRSVDIPSKDLHKYELTLQENDLLSKTYYDIANLFNRKFSAFVDEIKEKDNIHIVIELLDDKIQESDIESLYISMTNELCNCITEKQPREREYRLALPRDIKTNYGCSYVKMMRMINNKTKLNSFAVEIIINNIKIKTI